MITNTNIQLENLYQQQQKFNKKFIKNQEEIIKTLQLLLESLEKYQQNHNT